MTKKTKIILSVSSIFAFLLFTIVVKFVDVSAIGPQGSEVGLSTINRFVMELGKINSFYTFTNVIGYIPFVMVFFYAGLAIYEWIKRKDLKKVDRELFILALLYVSIAILYLLFEKLPINYRPVVLESGKLEPSYPSTHTMLAVTIAVSSVIINLRLFPNTLWSKVLNIALVVISSLIVIGRLISGVHWFTDIIGGLLLSFALVSVFVSIVTETKDEDASNSHSDK